MTRLEKNTLITLSRAVAMLLDQTHPQWNALKDMVNELRRNADLLEDSNVD